MSFKSVKMKRKQGPDPTDKFDTVGVRYVCAFAEPEVDSRNGSSFSVPFPGLRSSNFTDARHRRLCANIEAGGRRLEERRSEASLERWYWPF